MRALAAAGAHTVNVTFQGAVDGISAGAVSLTGVSQAAPQSAATNVDTSGADSISTSITTATANAWVVDVVGSGNSGSFTGGQRPDRALGHRGQRHDRRHQHEARGRGRRHDDELGPLAAPTVSRTRSLPWPRPAAARRRSP